MKNKTQKSILSIILVLTLFVGIFAALPLTANAAPAQTRVYLKGSGSGFDKSGWNNVFYLGGSEGLSDPNVWHLVIAPPKESTTVTSMQLTFTNGETFVWSVDMGFSTNGGGNNPGWVIVAPADWELAYVNSGKNNESGCYLETTGKVNNFNVSGFHKGSNPEIDPTNEFFIQKTVHGMLFGDWLVENVDPDDVEALVAGISFKLYKASDSGDSYIEDDFIADGTFSSAGFIGFDNLDLDNGWYAVVETLSGEAAKVFDEGFAVQYLYISKTQTGNYIVGFDYDAFYTIVNGYSDFIGNLNYEVRDDDGNYMLDNKGNIFYIGVTNIDTGVEYASFCAYGGAERFAGDGYNPKNLDCEGYRVPVESLENIADFIAAYNYIEDHFGNVNDNRILTQIVTWILLGAVDVESEGYANANWADLNSKSDLDIPLIDAVAEVIEGSKDEYTGNGRVVDIAYLRCAQDHPLAYCQPQFVPIYSCKSFDNRVVIPNEIGRLQIAKTVNGVAFDVWIEEAYKGDVDALLSGISFELYEASDGTYDDSTDPIAIGKLSKNDGLIDFGFMNLESGWYAVVEILSGEAADVFSGTVVVQYFYISATGTGYVVDNFDYDAFYTIVNGYGQGYTLGYPGLNNQGDIFPIAVKNTDSGIEYASFCANAGSMNFAGDNGLDCSGYMVAEDLETVLANYADFLAAYNYIEDHFGSLNENRAVTQVVTWILLGAIDVESPEFAAIEDWKLDKDAVLKVMENYEDYTGEGKVVNIVFMVCENPEHKFITCQPQIVPIYDPAFNNKFFTDFKYGDVSFTKVKYAGSTPLSVDANEFGFKLFKIVNNEEICIGVYYTDEFGVVTVKDLEPGSYVFREMWALFWDEAYHGEDGDYNLVWRAVYPGDDDGLYFEIDVNGNTVWPEVYALCECENPTVNNVVSCKHCVFWNNLDVYYSSLPHEAIPFNGGWIIVFDDNCGGYFEATYQAATCEVPGIIWLFCTECDMGTSITVEDPLGHNFEATGQYKYDAETGTVTIGEWYTCSNCGANELKLFGIDGCTCEGCNDGTCNCDECNCECDCCTGDNTDGTTGGNGDNGTTDNNGTTGGSDTSKKSVAEKVKDVIDTVKDVINDVKDQSGQESLGSDANQEGEKAGSPSLNLLWLVLGLLAVVAAASIVVVKKRSK